MRYNSLVNNQRIYELLERLGALLRAEERTAAHAFGLQPVHVHALHYLDRCNRYSDTPAGVTAYLGVTKGTVSQTLLVLEGKGCLVREADAHDRRQVRLRITPAGRKIVRACVPPPLLRDVPADTFGPETEATLSNLLKVLQREGGNGTFGLCRTCVHFREHAMGDRHQCGLTGEPLTERESGLICREHAVVEK